MSHRDPEILDQPPHIPTDDSRSKVEQLVGFGLTIDEIAYLIEATPVEVKTLYRHELQHGAAICNAKVASSLHSAACAGDTKAAMFWLRSKAGWRDVHKVETEEVGQRSAEKDALVNRILGMLTPAQAVALVAQQKPESCPAGAEVAQANGPAQRVDTRH